MLLKTHETRERLKTTCQVGWACLGAKKQQKWCAHISVKGKDLYLGGFNTFAEAIASRVAAEKTHRFHKNHGK